MKFSTFTRTALAGVAALMICGSAAADTWRVATEGTFPPFEFYNSQTGEVQGFEVDLVKAMAQKMGKDLKLETLGFDAIIPGILSGTIDTGAAGFSITPERGKRVLFSLPFYPKSRRKPSRKLFRNEFSNKNSVKLTDFFVDFNSVRMI